MQGMVLSESVYCELTGKLLLISGTRLSGNKIPLSIPKDIDLGKHRIY